VRHRVPEQMWVKVNADDSRILIAQGTDATLRQGSTFPDEQENRDIQDWKSGDNVD
jgi:hypothetical protein